MNQKLIMNIVFMLVFALCQFSCSNNEKIIESPSNWRLQTMKVEEDEGSNENYVDVDVSLIQSVEEIEKLAFVNDKDIVAKIKKRLETEKNKEFILALNYVLAAYGNLDAIQFLIDDVETMYEKSLKYLVRTTGHSFLHKDIWQERWLDEISDEDLKQETEKMRIPFKDLFEKISVYNDNFRISRFHNPPVYSNKYNKALASYGEAAIEPIMTYLEGFESRVTEWRENDDINLFNRLSEPRRFTAAIYLIGTETHSYGEFINKKARKALLKLVAKDFSQDTLFLLAQEAWLSDVPMLFKLLKKAEKHPGYIVKVLKYYDLENAPVHNEIPDSFLKTEFKFIYHNEKEYFENLVKSLSLSFEEKVPVDADLTYDKVFKYIDIEDTEEPSIFEGSINELIESMLYDTSTEFSFMQIEYYYENGKLYLISMETARKRWLKWWEENKEKILKKIESQQTQPDKK